MSRKIRSDSVLDSMPLHQQDALIGWLMEENLSPEKARDRLWQDFAVKTSETAIGTFYQRYVAPRLLRRSAQSAMSFPQESGGTLGSIPWEESSKALVRQHYFELLTSPSRDPKELALFAEQIAMISRGDLEREKLTFARQKHGETTRQKEEALNLARDKFQRETCELFLKWQANAQARAIAESTVSNADKIAALRQAFFADVDALEQSGEVQIPT